jgi:polysaccharide export outer membrane protein
MTSSRRWLLLAALLAGVSRPGAAQQAAPVPADSVRGVRPGDVVNVWIWRERDLSGEFPVDARGRVVLPMLGEVVAAGLSADALADEVRGGYRRFLNNPSIQVTVLRRVAVQGAVARPGLYPVDATVTVGNVIALAGGISPSGDARKLMLRRDGQVVMTSLGQSAVLERSPVQSGDEIYVPEKPWLARNGGNLIVGALLSMVVGVTVAVTTR